MPPAKTGPYWSSLMFWISALAVDIRWDGRELSLDENWDKDGSEGEIGAVKARTLDCAEKCADDCDMGAVPMGRRKEEASGKIRDKRTIKRIMVAKEIAEGIL